LSAFERPTRSTTTATARSKPATAAAMCSSSRCGWARCAGRARLAQLGGYKWMDDRGQDANGYRRRMGPGLGLIGTRLGSIGTLSEPPGTRLGPCWDPVFCATIRRAIGR